MIAAFVKYISVFLLSSVKFLGGPVAGVTMGLSFGATLALTVAGMMTSVFLFSVIGNAVHNRYVARQRLKNKPMFSKKNRRIVTVWKRTGMWGIAFLTPILLSPIVGTVLATVLGVSQGRILLHMLWSAVFWGFAITLTMFELSHLPFLQFLHK
ncbi:hypothetical protein TH61_04140 [Rufibacter sp. DG15C]|uniref:hypothetical protein n=1 Tax=Rufibacter sp. DG15C TaxID=1379909 RepID=UPI00078DD94B|nr:hypothetical protein [Rufibacter sp. DG15C]AMM50524.1 hypothetical protein TH61_04140 [Rufibacter sp. DG15C]